MSLQQKYLSKKQNIKAKETKNQQNKKGKSNPFLNKIPLCLQIFHIHYLLLDDETTNVSSE